MAWIEQEPHCFAVIGEPRYPPDPDFDKVRTCALSVMTGVVDGNELILEVMDGSQPPPLKEGRKQPHGRTVPFANGASYDWTGDGQLYSWMPHVALPQFRRQVRCPLSDLIKVPAGVPIPSPYKL